MTEEKKTSGRLSLEEIAAVEKLYRAGFTAAETASRLGHSEQAVKNVIGRMRDMARENDKEDLIASLKRKHYWEQIKRSLKDAIEIDYFEREWASLMFQLSTQDVLHTDEMMVRDLVLQDVQMFRISAEIAGCMKKRDDLEDMLHKEYEKDVDDRDLGQIQLLQQQLSAYTSSLDHFTRQYADSQNRKETLFKSLKTTRDQRYKEIKDAGRDIFSLVMMLDNIEQREKEGRITELMNMSSKKVEEAWMDVHEYDDGTLDHILLSPETMERQTVLQNIAQDISEAEEIEETDEDEDKNSKSEEAKEES